MQKTEVEQYKQTLLDMRTRTRGELNRMIEVVLDDAQSAGEHDHGASESIDKEVALENSEEQLRSAVNAALARIDGGTYGTCEDCGKKIAKARLDAIPYTAYCIECERERESAAP